VIKPADDARHSQDAQDAHSGLFIATFADIIKYTIEPNFAPADSHECNATYATTGAALDDGRGVTGQVWNDFILSP